MSIFKVDVKGNNIIITTNNTVIGDIPITSLYLNNGINAKTLDEFEKDQQKVNYLDSIKDGTNAVVMQSLNIYPKAEFGGYPTFPNDLKDFEKNLLEARKSYIEHTAWLKVQKGTVLDKGKDYNKCLWESGLGYRVFLNNPDKVKTVKTFGSFIDPLEKQNAEEVFPDRGATIQLSNNFMKLMGFGDHSFLSAKTVSNKAFEYNINIGCGNECGSSTNKCNLTHIGDNNNSKTPSEVYFSGNNQKKAFLKSSASTQSKVKFIVIKEWGDKTQVLIYLVYYYLLRGRDTAIMITCDMVVFMLCLNLSIPCIYTGAYNPPNLKLDPGKKRYSVLEFKPSDTPFMDAYTRLTDKINQVTQENASFIQAIKNLTTDRGAQTRISVGNNMLTFAKEFYSAVLNDINAIQRALKEYGDKLIDKYKNHNEQTGKLLIPDIEAAMKMLQAKYIIVPFIKQKKGMTGSSASNILTIIMTKSYTAQKPTDNSKPSIKQILLNKGIDAKTAEKESRKSFYDIASNEKNGFLASKIGGRGNIKYKLKGGKMKCIRLKGGDDSTSGLTADEVEMFPEDDNNIEAYIYTTNGEIENDTQVYKDYPMPNSPVFNPSISVEIEERNLLSNLLNSFSNTFSTFSPENPIYKTDNFKDTLYTLFAYESYINGYGSDTFTEDDLNRLINDYQLMTDVGEESIGVSKTTVKTNRSESFKRSLNLENLKEQRMKERNKSQKLERYSQLNLSRGIDDFSRTSSSSSPMSVYGGVKTRKRVNHKRKTIRTKKNNKLKNRKMQHKKTIRNRKLHKL
jgi:hypothetical protein